MVVSEASSRKGSLYLPTGPTSPTWIAGEDLARFPSESLHSFSFAHQNEDFIHSRQNVLKRSIDFMRDRMSWAAGAPGLLTAQAKLNGDAEMQEALQLLEKASSLGREGLGLDMSHSAYQPGPLTGPADVDGNIFDRAFASPRSDSPESLEGLGMSPPRPRKTLLSSVNTETMNRPGSAPPDSSLPFREGQRVNEEDLKPPIKQRRLSLKRTYTDTTSLSIQHRLMDAMARPYSAHEKSENSKLLSPTPIPAFAPTSPRASKGPAVHSHTTRWTPAAQAVFRTEAHAPWTISSANDLACLVFGVTMSEVRKLGILEVVQEDRRQWLEDKLKGRRTASDSRPKPQPPQKEASSAAAKSLGVRNGGVTAQLLSKPSSRERAMRKALTDDGSGSSLVKRASTKDLNHPATKSRGVLLCGDVVPIQKRNGATGSASVWVMEKRGGLIWVMEEITENVAYLRLSEAGRVTEVRGDLVTIWGENVAKAGISIRQLLPRTRKFFGDDRVHLNKITELKHFTARSKGGVNVPVTVTPVSGPLDLRISSFPHIAGIMVLSASNLQITSANSVFSGALFGQENPDGLSINKLIPNFDEILDILIHEEGIQLADGIVIPEHSFRRARALYALREGKADESTIFPYPSSLPAKHRDGSEVMVDLQMRVLSSETFLPDVQESAVVEAEGEDVNSDEQLGLSVSEVVYALWITYSRQMQSATQAPASRFEPLSRPITPPHQPSPGQTVGQPLPLRPSTPDTPSRTTHPRIETPRPSSLAQEIREAASQPISDLTPTSTLKSTAPPRIEPTIKKKTISDFMILEEMGQGAYGQVKLARFKKTGKKSVLKYVTKKRILVDTWTRDRRLGTVPLEIHVLDYLRRDGFQHPNIVEMEDFFEDSINYYIEMKPHGIPGVDLFDYIEIRASGMEEEECKNIFRQVVDAVHHLHTKALVVHRDVKDENVIMDGEGNIKLIDFGSAAYIKNGPFDVFVGTLGKQLPQHSAKTTITPFSLPNIY